MDTKFECLTTSVAFNINSDIKVDFLSSHVMLQSLKNLLQVVL